MSKEYRFLGHSMIGTFKEGDWLKIEKNKIKEVKIGNMAVFVSSKEAEGSVKYFSYF